MLVVSLSCYVLSAVGLILLWLWFSPAGQHCQFNPSVLFFTFLLILVFTATSLHEQVRLRLRPCLCLLASAVPTSTVQRTVQYSTAPCTSSLQQHHDLLSTEPGNPLALRS